MRIDKFLSNMGFGSRKDVKVLLKSKAVEVNGEIIPRSLHATHALVEGDRVEIVHALGGG